MGKLIPLILVVLGIAGGAGAGFFLRPDPPEPEEGMTEALVTPVSPDPATLALYEFPSQFMVPVVVEDRISATIVIKLALEYTQTDAALVAANAPRLRDALLQVMFDHANMGAFAGTFTDNSTLAQLRRALLEAAQKILGPQVVHGVLITDLLRAGS
jgi:flagellar protein FliL